MSHQWPGTEEANVVIGVVVDVFWGAVEVMIVVDISVCVVLIVDVDVVQDVKIRDVIKTQVSIIQIVPLFILSSILFNAKLLGI